nr:hypothetical protein HK105_005392 [Polyrhizophydium stewartii]
MHGTHHKKRGGLRSSPLYRSASSVKGRSTETLSESVSRPEIVAEDEDQSEEQAKPVLERPLLEPPMLEVLDVDAGEMRAPKIDKSSADPSVLSGGFHIPKDINPWMFRWLYSIRGVLNAIKIAEVDRVLTDQAASRVSLLDPLLPPQPPKSVDLTSPEVAAKMRCESPEDLAGAIRVKRILAISPDLREEKDTDLLDQIVGGAPCFARLPPTIRNKLLARCRAETHEAGTRLIREGQRAESLYVVLLGECAQHHIVQGPALNLRKDATVATFRVGQSIGEFTGATGLRTFSVSCVVRSELVALDRSDWFTVMKEAKSFESYQVDVLASLPLFAKVSRPLLVQLSQRWFLSEASISLAGDVGVNIFFIVKGKCRIMYQLPFVKTLVGSSRELKHKYSLQPFKGQKLQPEVDEMVYDPCDVGELHTGDFFPQLGREQVERSFIKSMASLYPTPSSTNLASPLSPGIPALFGASNAGPGALLGTGLLPGSRNPFTFWPPVRPPNNQYTIVSVDNVECAMLPRKDLLDLLPTEVIEQMMAFELKQYPSELKLREMQEKYLTSNGWRAVEEDVISRKLTLEMERDRAENAKHHAAQPKIGINPLGQEP